MPSYSGIPSQYRFAYAYHDFLDPASPAAGANLTIVVPGECGIVPLAAIATLTTSAAVANRLLSIDYIGARGTTYHRNAAAKVETATNGGRVYVWSSGRTVSENAANTPVFVPLLELLLDPGMKIQFTVDAIDAGDQLSAVHLVVLKVPTGAGGGRSHNPLG